MRGNGKPAPILGIERRALVDDRPAVAEGRPRLRVLLFALAGFVLGAACALLWAWHEWHKTVDQPSRVDGMR